LNDGYLCDGKVAFGFMFGNDEVCINGEVQPVEYKYFNEPELKIRKNMFVVWFCIYPKCPDYVDMCIKCGNSCDCVVCDDCD
ncbi:hypothetical protein, partial [Treponema sp. R6D11]